MKTFYKQNSRYVVFLSKVAVDAVHVWVYELPEAANDMKLTHDWVTTSPDVELREYGF